jgi:predicted ribosomally synthesized peptide with SipW-like signal peptide
LDGNKKEKTSAMNRVKKKLLALALIFGMNAVGILAVGRTVATFSDIETSSENYFSAAEFDFTATTTNTVFGIGAGETVRSILHLEGMTTDDTLLSFRGESPIPENCAGLEAALAFGETELYHGALTDLIGATTTKNIREIAIDELIIDIREMTGEPEYGTSCEWGLFIDGVQFPAIPDEGGFSDTETESWNIAFRKQIVLNEFLPNPQGVEYGFDFGEDADDMPQGEWVELYNNSNTPRDLSGWYIWDDSLRNDHKVFVTAENTGTATTTISAHGWLVVYMNRTLLNNGGDTVMLYSDTDIRIDSHVYTTDTDFCDLEPTSGDANDTAGSGSCSVPKNKSFARIPDGVGEWVDPVPTPGEPNIADVSDTMAAPLALDIAVLPVETATTSEATASSEIIEADEETPIIPESAPEPEISEPAAEVPDAPAAPEPETIAENPVVVPVEETAVIEEPIIHREETAILPPEETAQSST